VDLVAAEGREAGAGGEDGGDEVGAEAESAACAREEREREARTRPREGGDEDRVGAEVGGGEVGAEGAERVGEAARGGVEGDELREEHRVWVRACEPLRGMRARASARERERHALDIVSLRRLRERCVAAKTLKRILSPKGRWAAIGPQSEIDSGELLP
jgi:hypothetical protein